MIVRPRDGSEWDGASIHFRVRLPHGAPFRRYVPLPGSLPRLYLRGIPGPLPRVSIYGSDRLVTGGVGEGTGNAGAFLQAVVGAPGGPPTWRGDSTTFVGDHLDRFTLGERHRIDRLLGGILRFHARLFGVEPAVRVVVASVAEGGADDGLIFAVDDPRCFGIGGVEPEYLMLGSRVAHAWWGVGCRIVGPFGREVEAGIRAVAAMFWGDEVGSSARARRLEEWRTLARTRSPRQWLRAPPFDEGECARVALALYTAALEGAPMVERLRAITGAAWGTAVSEGAVREVFREIGAEV